MDALKEGKRFIGRPRLEYTKQVIAYMLWKEKNKVRRKDRQKEETNGGQLPENPLG